MFFCSESLWMNVMLYDGRNDDDDDDYTRDGGGVFRHAL